MTDMATPVAAPEAVASGARPGRMARILRSAARWLAVLPFGLYIALGLGAPTVAIAIAAFKNEATGAVTFSNVDTALHGVYLTGLRTVLELSVVTAILPGIFGFLIAYAIH